MRITLERASLLDAVSRLQKVVGSKTSMPILEGILISAEKGKVTLASYNLEMGMKKEIYARCDEVGDIVINARILADILRKMNGIEVEIETDDRLMCHLKSGDAIFDIMGMSANDYPEMPSVSEGKSIKISGSVLNEMVKRTIFAAAQIEGTRPILTGINISVKNGILQFVAIDGFRLAVRKQKTEINENFEFTATAKAVNEAVKLIDEEETEVEIVVGKRMFLFNINGYSFISRLLEGEFVNYEKIVPETYKESIVLDVSEFTDKVERVSLLINDVFSTPVRYKFTENEVVLSSATSLGRATETYEAKINGNEFEIGLNSRYMLDALRACDRGNILIQFNGVNSGILITSADENNKDFLYLVMPMRLK